MNHGRFILLTLGIALTMAGGARAEELNLASYNDLLGRLENLEATRLGGGVGDDCCDCGRVGFYGMYEAVVVTPYQSNNTAIIAFNDPTIEHLGFDWDMTFSNRFEAGYLAGTDGLGWRARYWQFDDGQTLFANDANGLLAQDEGVIVWGQADDGDDVIGLQDVDTATMQHSIDADVLDFEAHKQFSSCLAASVGLRYARIHQLYAAATDEGNATGDMMFEGAGPTVSIEGRHTMSVANRPVTGFASFRTSLLYGDQNFRATDDADAYILSILSDSALAANAAIQVGVEYNDPCNGFFARAATEAQYWANVGSPNPSAIFGTDSEEYNVDDPRDEDLGFLGFSLSAGFTR